MDSKDAHEEGRIDRFCHEGWDESNALCRGKEERDGQNGNAGTVSLNAA
jgi:hypothetical protein